MHNFFQICKIGGLTTASFIMKIAILGAGVMGQH